MSSTITSNRRRTRRLVIVGALAAAMLIPVTAASASYSMRKYPNNGTYPFYIWDGECGVYVLTSDLTQRASSTEGATGGEYCYRVGLQVTYTRYGTSYATSYFYDWWDYLTITYYVPTGGDLQSSWHYAEES